MKDKLYYRTSFFHPVIKKWQVFGDYPNKSQAQKSELIIVKSHPLIRTKIDMLRGEE